MNMYLDGHSSTVKTKRKEGPFSLESLIADGKFTLGQGERVAQMQTTIHIRIWKAHEVFRFLGLSRGWLRRGIYFKSFRGVPFLLDSLFNLDKIVSLCKLCVFPDGLSLVLLLLGVRV